MLSEVLIDSYEVEKFIIRNGNRRDFESTYELLFHNNTSIPCLFASESSSTMIAQRRGHEISPATRGAIAYARNISETTPQSHILQFSLNVRYDQLHAAWMDEWDKLDIVKDINPLIENLPRRIEESLSSWHANLIGNTNRAAHISGRIGENVSGPIGDPDLISVPRG